MSYIDYLIWNLICVLLLSSCHCDSWESSYTYLMADFSKCQRERPHVVVWVQGRASNPTRRSIIRELLANKKAYPPHLRVSTFFMVGQVKDSKLQMRLQYEFELYRDIVQNEYTEHYRNQTAKMISAINFLADYCGQSELAIRIDDDVIFHPATMIEKVKSLMTKDNKNTYNQTEDYHKHSQYIKSHKSSKTNQMSEELVDPHQSSNLLIFPNNVSRVKRPPQKSNMRLTNQNTILCHILSHRKVIRPDMKRTYPVDYSVLPNETIYPDFCAGFFIAISMDLLPKFKQLFSVEPPFWIDDSYLGVLQRRLKTTNVDAKDFLFFNVPKSPPLRKLISGTADVEAIAVHLMQGVYYYKRLARSTALDELSYYLHL